MNVNTYETKHVEKDCTCTFVAIPYQSCSRILFDGGFPVVDLSLSGNQLLVEAADVNEAL